MEVTVVELKKLELEDAWLKNLLAERGLEVQATRETARPKTVPMM
jgi:hypothetical protein